MGESPLQKSKSFQLLAIELRPNKIGLQVDKALSSTRHSARDSQPMLKLKISEYLKLLTVQGKSIYTLLLVDISKISKDF